MRTTTLFSSCNDRVIDSRNAEHSRRRAIAVVAVVLMLVGCASNATVARKKFTAISDAAEAVKTAMLVFNDRYQKGLQTEDQRAQVLKTYAIYQKAALDGVAAERAGLPVDGLKMVNDAALPLLDLLASFGSSP